MEISFKQDIDSCIEVMRNASQWMEEQGLEISKWWDLKNLNKDFLLQYTKPHHFYVGMIDEKPAVAAVLQMDQGESDWEAIDQGNPPRALYVHWLCVSKEFLGKGLSKKMMQFAEELALENGIHILRLDTDATKTKLRSHYEDLGFELVQEIQEDYRKTAFYQKIV